MEKCNLCPNSCMVSRTNQVGACGVTQTLKIAKYYPHMYEEPPISGSNGSGTIFFTGCSLKCVFCQNYELSRNTTGKEISVKQLVDIFHELEGLGVHNVNFVNPTHYTNQIKKAFEIYKPKRVVWNTHGYENIQTLEEIDEYIDVYLPDLKYFSPEVSYRYTGKRNYFEKAFPAIKFMAEKPFKTDGELLVSGTIVRHLILPQNVNDSLQLLDAFAQIKDKCALSLMAQYTPFGEIDAFPELQRKLTKREYEKVLNYALSLGIENLYVQDLKSSSQKYIPTWDY